MMCGIIGYLAKDKSDITKYIIKSLKKLEYRGYDSAGICFLENTNFRTYKSIGEIKKLEEKVENNILSNCAIAHTRWATHGKVTLSNTHPHTSSIGNWIVVHNGIIENYLSLKEKFLKDINFYGETDTEVLPNLMEKFGFFETLKLLVGSFAICAINKNTPNTLYIAKKNSPLYVANSINQTMIASDPIVFAEKFTHYIQVPENCYAIVTTNKIQYYNFDNLEIYPKSQKLGIFERSANKGKYPYFAEKEIKEIPKVLTSVIDSYTQIPYLDRIDEKFLQGINSIYLVGCGTAYHACLMGEKYIEKFTGKTCKTFFASEFRYFPPKIDKKTLCIFASQSGETADTMMSLKLAKDHDAKTIALVNVPYSSIAKSCDVMLPLCAGMEIAVVSTKAYSAMLFVFFILAKHLGNIKNGKNKEKNAINYLKTLKKCNFLKNFNTINKFVNLIKASDKVFFIGKGEDYITSLEAGLKLKEITYINCVSIPSGELKHGTLALVDDKSLVFVTATDSNTLGKNLASASEIKSRGGKIVLVTNLELSTKKQKDIDYIFTFDSCPKDLSSMLSISFYQYLAYKTCVSMNLSPDKPRNLAKSVTVE